MNVNLCRESIMTTSPYGNVVLSFLLIQCKLLSIWSLAWKAGKVFKKEKNRELFLVLIKENMKTHVRCICTFAE